jgi:hypothetical protein
MNVQHRATPCTLGLITLPHLGCPSAQGFLAQHSLPAPPPGPPAAAVQCCSSVQHCPSLVCVQLHPWTLLRPRHPHPVVLQVTAQTCGYQLSAGCRQQLRPLHLLCHPALLQCRPQLLWWTLASCHLLVTVQALAALHCLQVHPGSQAGQLHYPGAWVVGEAASSPDPLDPYQGARSCPSCHLRTPSCHPQKVEAPCACPTAPCRPWGGGGAGPMDPLPAAPARHACGQTCDLHATRRAVIWSETARCLCAAGRQGRDPQTAPACAPLSPSPSRAPSPCPCLSPAPCAYPGPCLGPCC